MSATRKGRRVGRRVSVTDYTVDRDRHQRALALVSQLYDNLHGSANAVSDDLVTALEDAVDKLTQGQPSEATSHNHLDNEATYEPADSDEPGLEPDQEEQKFSYRPAARLEHHILPKVGRSSVHRPRPKYFPPIPELDEEEQRQRTARTQAANLRRAAGKARDLAVAEDCGQWVGLTVDDLHIDQLTPDTLSDFMHRLSRRYEALTGKHLHYVAVIGTHSERLHVHGLFSRDLDPEILRGLWKMGVIDEIVEIPNDEIECRVNYMADNIRDNRVSHCRFFRSRGYVEERLVIPVESVEDAREGLADMIAPGKPRLRSAQPFGDNPRYAFRFKPVRSDGDG